MKFTLEIITGAGLVDKYIEADGYESTDGRYVFYKYHIEEHLSYDCDCMKDKMLVCSTPKELTIINKIT